MNFFCCSRCRRRFWSSIFLWTKNFADMVTRCHTSPFFINLIPRPVRATRVRGGGLEPSANFPDKLDRWRHLRNRWELLGTRVRFLLWTFLLEPANLKIRGSRGGIFNELFEAISLLPCWISNRRLQLMYHMSPVIHSSKTMFIAVFQLVQFIKCRRFFSVF